MGPEYVSGTASWRPVLSGTTAQTALDTVDALAESIASLSSGERDPSLAGGQAGLALLCAWQAAAGAGSPQAGDLAWRCLDRAIDAVATIEMDNSLFHGFVGVGWAAHFVDRLLHSDGDDRNEAIDDALCRLLSRPDLWPAPHDLVEGVTGAGVYALERLPRPSAMECLHHVIDRLEESARHDENGIYWWTPATELSPDSQEDHPSGVADLGLAHGVVGAISLLGALCGAGVERARTRPLLEGAVSWLRAQAVATEAGPTFPIWVAPGFQPEPARSAWCYGDPGVAAALLVAARGAGEPQWEKEAVALACRAADRSAAETGVEDAGFCHGAAGLAHLYNRMYQATGESELGLAARDWLERTLELCHLALGNGSPAPERPEQRDGQPWWGLGLLYGAAGIALVLSAAATAVEPIWDRMFLVSARHVSPLPRP
ncbi:MAG: lanthionine synthetase C family protein [Actinomycetota bacterium]|nr:lanthionine synthetase C family protein [Actinomycetota bacterium]